jgi:hypothetical protein
MTRAEELYTELINGGELRTQGGHHIYFDSKKSKIICAKNGTQFEYHDIRELAVQIAFQSVEIGRRTRIITRNDWYVLTIDEVKVVVPTKQLAVDYCVKITQDRRANLGVTKVNTGVYQYSGPRNMRNYYIGLREPLTKYGFGEAIQKWHSNQAVKRTFA